MSHPLILSLHKLGVVKTAPSEVSKDFFAPFQIDFPLVLSHAELAKGLSRLLYEKVATLPFDLLIGVPPFGGPFASFLAWEKGESLALRRSDVGPRELTPKLAGKFKEGQRCLLIHDVLRMGSDVLELVDEIEAEGLKVHHLAPLIDLEIGAKQKLKRRGITIHPVFTMREIVETLFEAEKIPGDRYKLITDFYETL